MRVLSKKILFFKQINYFIKYFVKKIVLVTLHTKIHPMELNFISLASGSSGNCFYIGTNDYGFLIDAGIGTRTIRKRLSDAGLSLDYVRAVFITHDHIDHIKSAGVLSEKHFLPVYTTEKIHNGMNKNPVMKEKVRSCRKLIDKNTPIVFDDFTVEAFNVSHDGHDNVGYTITFGDKRFTIATDLGYVCESAHAHICRANYLVIEANYDEKMLSEGRYPFFLQQRIQSDKGHLSNDQTAEYLSKNFNNELSHIWLCHLSKENNTPDLAYNTIAKKLIDKGVKIGDRVQLTVLPRTTSTEVFLL